MRKQALQDVTDRLNALLTEFPEDLVRVLLARHVVSKAYAESSATICTESSPGVFTQSGLELLNSVLGAGSAGRIMLMTCDGKPVGFTTAACRLLEFTNGVCP